MLGLNWPRELGMFVSNPGLCQIPLVRPGREVPIPPLGLEVESLKNGTTHHWISRSRARYKQTLTNRNSRIIFKGNHYAYVSYRKTKTHKKQGWRNVFELGGDICHTVLWQLYIENQKHIPNFWIYDAFLIDKQLSIWRIVQN